MAPVRAIPGRAAGRMDGHEKELCGGEAHTTNQQMELQAAVEALKALTGPAASPLSRTPNMSSKA